MNAWEAWVQVMQGRQVSVAEWMYRTYLQLNLPSECNTVGVNGGGCMFEWRD